MSTATPENSNVAETRMTIEEYLKFERASELRHELIDGEVVEVTGASEPHNRISMNLSSLIHVLLMQADSVAAAYAADLRVRIPNTDRYRYPDIVVSDGEPQLEDAELDTLINPQAIIEILSPNTERVDRESKFEDYKTIPTFNEYILVAQDRMHIERFVKNDDGSWSDAEISSGADAELTVSSIDAIPLTRVYHRVKLTK